MDSQTDLYRKRGFWDTPRNLYIVLGVFATFVGILAGWVGYDIARAPQTIVVQLPPGTVITVPAAPQAAPAK